MSLPLPSGNFRWIPQDQLQEIDYMAIPPDGPRGLFIEVNIEIPFDLHDYLQDYCPAPESMEVVDEMLSPKLKEMYEKYSLKHMPGRRLQQTLYDKHEMVLHYRTLQCYVSLGCRVTGIISALQFDQYPYLKEFIDFNTEQRKKATNTFEHNFFKLCNNATFGTYKFKNQFKTKLSRCAT